MNDLLDFIIGCAASFVLGMAFHSLAGHYCKDKLKGFCRFFHHD